MADVCEVELQALTKLTGTTLLYALAFIGAFWGLKKAIVDGDSKGWIIVLAAAMVGPFSGVFNAVRDFGYGVIQPLNPTGGSEKLENRSGVLGSGSGSTGGSGAPQMNGGAAFTPNSGGSSATP